MVVSHLKPRFASSYNQITLAINAVAQSGEFIAFSSDAEGGEADDPSLLESRFTVSDI